MSSNIYSSIAKHTCDQKTKGKETRHAYEMSQAALNDIIPFLRASIKGPLFVPTSWFPPFRFRVTVISCFYYFAYGLDICLIVRSIKNSQTFVKSLYLFCIFFSKLPHKGVLFGGVCCFVIVVVCLDLRVGRFNAISSQVRQSGFMVSIPPMTWYVHGPGPKGSCRSQGLECKPVLTLVSPELIRQTRLYRIILTDTKDGFANPDPF